MEFKMMRSFLPIGQGAFYCERFEIDKETINIVYDCGSKRPKLVKKQIERLFCKNEKIDVVFISHLHDDHISGLKYLLEYCKVDWLVLPLMHEPDIKITLAYNWLSNANLDEFTRSFIADPQKALNDNSYSTKICWVREAEDNQSEDDISINDPDFNRENSTITVNSGENILNKLGINIPKNLWVYIPFNFREKDRIKDLSMELEKCGVFDINEKNILELWQEGNKDMLQKIKETYEKLPGSLNINSMIVYSGEEKGEYEYEQYFINSYYYMFLNYAYYKFFPKITRSGCLYTGDYDASDDKWQQLTEKYTEYWENIGCIQVPHHGSKDSYNCDISQKRNSFFVISAGETNQYNHPHYSVIMNLLFNHCYPFIVTENFRSMIRFMIK